MSIYCPYCGKELPDDSAFCFQCGKKIPNINATEPTSTEPAEPSNVSEPKTQVEIKQPKEEPQSTESISSENVSTNTDEFDLTKKGKSIASFVLGLIGVCLFGSWLGFILGIIGFFIGVSAYKHKQGIKGLIISGMILSTVAVILRFVIVMTLKILGVT